MTIDKNPLIDIPNETLTVSTAIDVSETVDIFVNGLFALTNEDIDVVVGSDIVLLPNSGIDFTNDDISIMYLSL